jgi:hypothetical protein
VHAPRPAARASRVRTAVCTSNGKCVPGRKLVSGTHNSVIYQSLRSLCTSCTSCTTFSEFILGLLKNTVLFSKKNFNLKTPGTAGTALETPAITHFLPVSTWYTRWYSLVQTPSYLVQTKNIELNVNHVSWIIEVNRSPSLSTRATRSSVGFVSVLKIIERSPHHLQTILRFAHRD